MLTVHECTPELRNRYIATLAKVGTAMWKFEESLDEREQMIVQRFSKGELLSDMALEFGVSAMAVSRIFKRAMAKAERFLLTKVDFEGKTYRLAHRPAEKGEKLQTLIYVKEGVPAGTVLEVHGIKEGYAKVYPTWYQEGMTCFGFVAFLEHEDYAVLVEINEEE